MRIDIDKEADSAYIYFKEIAPGEVKTTITLNEDINVDLDAQGKTLGIEIIDASRNLPKAALQQAEK